MWRASNVAEIDLTEILKPYKNEWVALTPDYKAVVGHGSTPAEALADARSKGVRDPVLTRVPEDYGTYVL